MSKLRALVDIYRNKLEENMKYQNPRARSVTKKAVTKPMPTTTTNHTSRLLKTRTEAHLRTRRIPQFTHKPLITSLDQSKFAEILKRSRSFVEENRSRYKSSLQKEKTIQSNLPNLKFKRIDFNPDEGSPERLEPKNKARYSVSLKSRKVNLSDLKRMIVGSFDQKKRIVCVVYKCGRIFQHSFVPCGINLQNSETNFIRQSFKTFQEQIYQEFFINKNKPIYLFDIHGSPITKLTSISPNTYILLLSIHPFPDKLLHLKNSMIAAHWDSGIPLEQYLQKASNKRLSRQDYLRNYTSEQNPLTEKKRTTGELQLEKIRNIYQGLDGNDHQKSSQFQIQETIGKDIFFRSTSKKRDFNKQDVKLIKSLSLQFDKQPLAILSRPSVQYPLTHRDLIRKKYSSHDFVVDTKFNRQQLLQLKSIYDSLVSLAIKNHGSKGNIMRYGVDKETLIEGIKMFRFETSSSLVRDMLPKQEYVDWRKYLQIMESLVHKQSDGALDEYLNSVKYQDGRKELKYEELLKIVKYGLEKLLLYKDSFYDGYEVIITRNIFNHLGLGQDQLLPVEDLRKLATDSKFKHIFLS